jgi:uracil-DNA glycosylase
MSLEAILAEIRKSKSCRKHLPADAQPVLQVGREARLCIASQAPGIRAQQSGIPFNDRSGDRLRDWMGIDRPIFYDVQKVAIVPMGFYFPGHTPSGGDKPPPSECAARWRNRLLAELPHIELTLLVGSYAQVWHLQDKVKPTLTETVAAWRDYAPHYIPLPHPSWHNNAWLTANPWFARNLLPYLKRRAREVLA